jgi:hypothetical protein
MRLSSREVTLRAYSGGWSCSNWALIYIAPILKDHHVERHITWSDMTTLCPWFDLDWFFDMIGRSKPATLGAGFVRSNPILAAVLTVTSFCLWDSDDTHVDHVVQFWYLTWLNIRTCEFLLDIVLKSLKSQLDWDWACNKIILILASQPINVSNPINRLDKSLWLW